MARTQIQQGYAQLKAHDYLIEEEEPAFFEYWSIYKNAGKTKQKS